MNEQRKNYSDIKGNITFCYAAAGGSGISEIGLKHGFKLAEDRFKAKINEYGLEEVPESEAEIVAVIYAYIYDEHAEFNPGEEDDVYGAVCHLVGDSEKSYNINYRVGPEYHELNILNVLHKTFFLK